jgi:hypothetical protein
MTKNKMINSLLLAGMLSVSTISRAADPLGALQALDSVLKATSLVDMVAKAISSGVPADRINTVPRLKVVADCGDCKISNASKMLMVSSYSDMAEKNQISINQNEVIVFNITSMWSRPSFIRGALGALSGADVIRGHFENDDKTIGEYSISHEMGIDEITQKLGENLLKFIVAKNIQKLEATVSETRPPLIDVPIIKTHTD